VQSDAPYGIVAEDGRVDGGLQGVPDIRRGQLGPTANRDENSKDQDCGSSHGCPDTLSVLAAEGITSCWSPSSPTAG